MKSISIIIAFLLLFSSAHGADLIWEWPAESYKTDLLKNPASLKILWWNTACGNINAQLKEKKNEPDSLYTNINTLAGLDNPPDIFMLGEHCPGNIPKKTQALLKKIYPHNFNLEHSNPYGRTRNGIWVFSKWKLSKISQKTLEPDVSAAANKITARTYLLLKVSAEKGDFYLSPVHFYNPWSKYSGFDLVFAAVGTDNVNYKQAEAHFKFLSQDVDFKKDAVLVMGDFNSAKQFYGVNMSGFNYYASQIFDKGVGETTFPTPSARALGNNFPDVIIDQALATFTTGGSIMLPLKGSDHFPILFSF
jgi:endonuclease/exonuclease/phosphatase family metal-dependent hydrolase